MATAATQTQILQAAADTYVRKGGANTNEGASTFVRLRASGENRALVRFDQAAIVNALGGGTLVSAKLQLDIVKNSNNWGPGGRSLELHRLNMNWTEGNGRNADVPNKLDFRGTGPSATWNCATDSNIANQKADCDEDDDWEMRLSKQKPNSPPWVETPTASVLKQRE